MSDLEGRLRDAVTARTDAYSPPPYLPDRIDAAVARRRRRDQRRRVGMTAGALFAVVAVVALLVFRPGGDDKLDTIDDNRPDRTVTTVPPTTPQTTAPSTTGSSAPVIEPVTTDELADLSYPFANGVGSFPEPCRAYWESNDPGEQGLGGDTNGIGIERGEMAIADLDGDGVADGIATFTCTTIGTLPPDGVLVLLAADRSVVTSVGEELRAANRSLRGDDRTDLRRPDVPDGSGQVVVAVGSYVPSDANAGPSTTATAYFELEGGELRLVDLVPGDEPPVDGGGDEEALTPDTPLTREGVGPVRAGMTIAEAEAAGVTITVGEPIDPTSTCNHGSIGDRAFLLERAGTADADPADSVIRSVDGTATSEGVAVGDPIGDMDAAYGAPTRTSDYPYLPDGEIRVYEAGGFAYAAVSDGTAITDLRSGDPGWVAAIEGCA